MAPRQQIEWRELFERDGDATLRFRVFKKNGAPFLILPADRRLSSRALDLYPAQTHVARLAKFALRSALTMGVPIASEPVELQISGRDPFVRFLGECAQSELPRFAILAGNPRAAGRRFIVLVFGKSRKPVAVVKAGMGADATALIEKERSFLASAPVTAQGVPRLRASFGAGGIEAFALDFIEGDTPRGANPDAIGPLLATWLDVSRRISLRQLAAWQRLVASFPSTPSLQKLVRDLGERESHPTLMHGDFAPWNVKISNGNSWTALDWERAELAGVPAWDWFHYVVQTSILVAREKPVQLASDMEDFLNSEPLRAYAERAGIGGFTRELLLAYLLYCSNVLKPTEGLATVRQLLTDLATRWLLAAA